MAIIKRELRDLCPHGFEQRCDAENIHDPRQVIGEHAQRHLAAHILQPLHQKMGCPHPCLDRAEGMLDSLTALAHGLRVFVQSSLDGFQNRAPFVSARTWGYSRRKSNKADVRSRMSAPGG